MILGRNLIVSIDGVPVAGSKSCQFQISQNFIQACAPTEGRTFRKIPTTYDWSMSVDCLVPSGTLTSSLTDKLTEGTRVLLTFTDGSGNNRAGFAYVKSCDESGSVGSLAKFSASFESDGPLYKYKSFAADFFNEGSGVHMKYQNNTITFQFSMVVIRRLTGVQISESPAGLLQIYGAKSTWALYQADFATIKSNLSNEQQPTATLTACGNSDGSVTLSANTTYTFLYERTLLNPAISPILLFLYK